MTDYAWYVDTLAGKKVPVHEGTPRCGFFRRRASRNGPWLPAAIWLEGMVFRCRVGNEMRDAAERRIQD